MEVLTVTADAVPDRFDLLPWAREIRFVAKNSTIGTVPENACLSYRGLIKLVFIGVWNLDDSSFRGCVDLCEVDVTEGVVLRIGIAAFAGCIRLKKLNFAANNDPIALCDRFFCEYKTKLGLAAFAGCIHLVCVELPPIGAFGDRHGKKIHYPHLRFPEPLSGDRVPPQVILKIANPPGSKKVPCIGVFWGCTSLTSVTIRGNESSNLSLQRGTFTGAPLAELLLHCSVKAIDLSAFDPDITRIRVLRASGAVKLCGVPPTSLFGIWIRGTCNSEILPRPMLVASSMTGIRSLGMSSQRFLENVKIHFRQPAVNSKYLTQRHRCTLVSMIIAMKRGFDDNRAFAIGSVPIRLVLSFLTLRDLDE